MSTSYDLFNNTMCLLMVHIRCIIKLSMCHSLEQVQSYMLNTMSIRSPGSQLHAEKLHHTIDTLTITELNIIGNTTRKPINEIST